ncbi:MAG TPA: GTPase HflX [Bdellovibrionota bacterium]|nr:GTPase HflX [Bdellovibrionota bacterium]
MLDEVGSLLPGLSSGKKPRVLSIGFDEDSMDELERLLTTLDVETVGRIHAVSRKISPATFIGKGKIEEAKLELEKLNGDAVILDVELSPNQLRNLEQQFKKPILDRPGVIIEIFSQHARTREAKTQVALARLQYLLPRLTHFWTHFERQRGGSPSSRGMGEKQIEVDRRMVKKQMAVLHGRLAAIERERKVQRAGRRDVLKVALVGYTNAGKSTLLNALTHSQVRAEDKLFATLDASVRSLDPNSHPPIVAIDTVGFISRLPPALVASFRSTLEELEEADLLVHVVDASSSQAREQLEATELVLRDLKVDTTPRIIVLNKADRLGEGPGAKNRAKLVSPGAMLISALDAQDVVRLRDMILDHFKKGLEVWEVLVPYSESKLESQIYAHGSVEINRHLEKGTFYRLRIEQGWARKLGLEKYRL